MLEGIEGVVLDYDFVVAKDDFLERYFGPPYRTLRQVSPDLTEFLVSFPSKSRLLRMGELLTERLLFSIPIFNGHHISLLDPALVEAYSEIGKIGIVSRRHRRRQIEPKLEEFGYRGCVSVVVGTEDVGFFGTGRKEYIPRCMEMINIPPANLLFVGDSPEDIQVARECGAKTCGVTGGYHSETSLQRVNPTYGLSRARGIFKMLIDETVYQPTYFN